MGIDSCIYVRTTDGNAPALAEPLPQGCSFSTISGLGDGAPNYTIDNPWRYYGKEYERGPWVLICDLLLSLLGCSNVEHVWYFGDNTRGEAPITHARINELSLHFMQFGNRPYQERWEGFGGTFYNRTEMQQSLSGAVNLKERRRVVVAVQGGIVQSIAADHEDVEVLVIDYDTDGEDAERMCSIPQSDGTTSNAVAAWHWVDHSPEFIANAVIAVGDRADG